MIRRPVGVFDSGVGGLTVFRALERQLPRERFVYLGDTARVPYGTRSPETIRRYSVQAARFLVGHRVKMIVVACNSASSVALEAIADAAQVPVVGVIDPGARRAVEIARGGPIGVIGTRATIASGAYPTAIERLAPGTRVVSRACPLFVPLVEEGWTEGEVARGIAERYLAPLRDAGVAALVLGCTHYPLLNSIIGEVMGPQVALIDSASAVAAAAQERLTAEKDGDFGTEPSDGHHYYVTDTPEPFQVVAESFLGRPLGRLERVSLEPTG